MIRKSALLLAALLMLAAGAGRPARTYAQDAADPTQPLPFYLLTIRGTPAAGTLEEAQILHNATAGAPESVAAAKSLGDLSHMVYTSAQPAESGPGEILFIDQWNSIEGLGQFFANPQVQEQAGQLFAERDAVAWTPAEGFYDYHLSTPYGNNERIIVLVRGMVSTREDAMMLHNQIVGSQINAAHQAGDLSHEVYFRMSPPGEPESLEFLAVDVWNNMEGMLAYYQNPDFQAGAMQLFTAAPDISIWNQTTGDWVEW